MRIEASVRNQPDCHAVTLATDGASHSIAIAPRASGFGSRANGGELLCLALATCYCNDLYREAAKRGIVVAGVDVDVAAEFGAPGEPAASIDYRASVSAHAPEPAIRDLMLHTDRVAEIQNTVRRGLDVRFEIAGATRIE
jgi:organic hydroperoxide reductase OsmC/OhrA